MSRGIEPSRISGGPLAGLTQIVNPLNYGARRRPEWPLIAAVHGDTWNMAHELFLTARHQAAAANTNFGQDENSHGRFPGGGSTVRFVREAGWGNAMRYMLTGDHWTAADALRMGVLQEIAETPQATLDLAVAIANKVAACAPSGIQTTLASAHLRRSMPAKARRSPGSVPNSARSIAPRISSRAWPPVAGGANAFCLPGQLRCKAQVSAAEVPTAANTLKNHRGPSSTDEEDAALTHSTPIFAAEPRGTINTTGLSALDWRCLLGPDAEPDRVGAGRKIRIGTVPITGAADQRVGQRSEDGDRSAG